MSETHGSNPSVEETSSRNDHHEPGLYEIRVKGHLGDQWEAWFEGMTLTRQDNGDTLLTGLMLDQAALHGLLRKVRDLGIPLLSVIRVEEGQQEAPDVKL